VKRQDRFRDWNLYHKSVVIMIASIIGWTLLHAVLVYDRAFELKQKETISVDTSSLWPWLIEDTNRHRWSSQLVDLSALTGKAGDIGATRLLFWKEGTKRWHSSEAITQSLKARLFVSEQESDHDKRWVHIELKPKGPCSTEVAIKETLYPLSYSDRFWFFRKKERHQKRLDTSLTALQRWAQKDYTCSSNE